MTSNFKNFHKKIHFIGLTNEEKVNVEVGFHKYDLSYSDDFQGKLEILKYDLICICQHLYDPKLKLLGIPFFIIGEKEISDSVGQLSRPLYVIDWLKTISNILPVVSTPTLKRIEVGTIVRSKTTPAFGKGVVTQVLSETEVIVKFPLNKLLPKHQSLRCHCSQLQILGNINDYN